MTKFVGIIAVLTVLAGPSIVAAGLEPVAVIIDQSGAPLQLTRYQAAYKEETEFRREGIEHFVRYENVSDRLIVAVQIRFVSFSVFNRFLDLTSGVDIRDLGPGDGTRGEWVATPLSDFTFHTGVAYVSAVRFESGEIWEADLELITARLQDIEKDFNSSVLTDNDEDPS